MQDLAYGDYDEELFEVVYDKIVDTSRWSVISEMVFKNGGMFYKTSYSTGATESQDESPYEYDGDMIEVKEVFPKEEVITVYV
jgi:hypothetical protein